jgi:hypothetical protein
MPRYLRTYLFSLACLWASPVLADNIPPIGGGGSCSGGPFGGGSSVMSEQAAGGNGLYACNNGTWVEQAFIIGGVDDTNSAPSCNSTNAGMVKYSSSTFYGCNGSVWVPIDSGLHFIATQTAASSASLQFTNLPTSYNTLFLNCQGLQPATNGVTLEMQFGEGATPTWEVASYRYVDAAEYDGATTPGAIASTSASAIHLSNTTDVGSNSSYNSTAQLYISSVGSSSIYKMVQGQVSYFNGSGNSNNWNDEGTYTGDTNAITAIRILFSSGNITSGTCSLYGMN